MAAVPYSTRVSGRPARLAAGVYRLHSTGAHDVPCCPSSVRSFVLRVAPTVSVVVPTKNSALTLGRLLRSVRAQSFPAVELIVVDNHSNDDTISIAARYADRVVDHGPERSAQRNRGVALASGQYVFMVDSDMELTPGTVAACVATARESGAAAIVVPERTVGDRVCGVVSSARASVLRRRLDDRSRTLLRPRGLRATRRLRRDVDGSRGLGSTGADEELWRGSGSCQRCVDQSRRRGSSTRRSSPQEVLLREELRGVCATAPRACPLAADSIPTSARPELATTLRGAAPGSRSRGLEGGRIRRRGPGTGIDVHHATLICSAVARVSSSERSNSVVSWEPQRRSHG